MHPTRIRQGSYIPPAVEPEMPAPHAGNSNSSGSTSSAPSHGRLATLAPRSRSSQPVASTSASANAESTGRAPKRTREEVAAAKDAARKRIKDAKKRFKEALVTEYGSNDPITWSREERAANSAGFVNSDGTADLTGYKRRLTERTAVNAGFATPGGVADVTRYNRHLNFCQHSTSSRSSNRRRTTLTTLRLLPKLSDFRRCGLCRSSQRNRWMSRRCIAPANACSSNAWH